MTPIDSTNDQNTMCRVISRCSLNDKEDLRKFLKMNRETFQVYTMIYYVYCKEKYEQWKQK